MPPLFTKALNFSKNWNCFLQTTHKVSTPGRICLFGEHQDYLGLPVIAAAISKRIFIDGKKVDGNSVKIELPDISQTDSFLIEEKVLYKNERDYLRSAFNVLVREGYSFTRGIECKIHGEIPINAGTSSSSALIIAWIQFLILMSDKPANVSLQKIAELGYKAEVLEFAEPGGMMDHYSTACGNIIWLESTPKINLQNIHARLGTFVLANSLEPKDTKYILSRVKKGVMNITQILSKLDPGFSIHTIQEDDVYRYEDELNGDTNELLKGTIRNRDLTFEAYKVLSAEFKDEQRFGRLMNEHQKVLRDVLQISTPKIDNMIETSLKAGAFGAKINGSGGGGCMFAYAPKNPEKVLEALKKYTQDAWIVTIDEGTRIEN